MYTCYSFLTLNYVDISNIFELAILQRGGLVVWEEVKNVKRTTNERMKMSKLTVNVMKVMTMKMIEVPMTKVATKILVVVKLMVKENYVYNFL